jgi:GNAT superfamily N-acetyltransferase
MSLTVTKSSLIMIDELRRQRRSLIDCQIVRDSILPRGLADPYLIQFGNQPIGYAGVWNKHFPGRIMEFFVVENAESAASPAFDKLVLLTGASDYEAQSNLAQMTAILSEKCTAIQDKNLLFGEPSESSDATNGPADGVPHHVFRHRRPGDRGPEGDWVLEIDQNVIGAGGILKHYNPPFGDLFMEIIPGYRKQGLGSELVRRLIIEAVSASIRPTARCDADNNASRRTLERGGLVCCGRLQVGRITRPVS